MVKTVEASDKSAAFLFGVDEARDLAVRGFKVHDVSVYRIYKDKEGRVCRAYDGDFDDEDANLA